MTELDGDIQHWVETGECRNPLPMSAGLYQRVLITLNDGRTLVYTGEAQVFPDRDAQCAVVKVQFVEPQKLPNGCELGPLSAL